MSYFVKRNANGQIIAVSKEACAGFEESINENDEALSVFFKNSIAEKLNQSDMQLIRVLEDLIETLLEKNIICLTDFPEGARQKIIRRRLFRENLGELISPDDNVDL